MMPLWDGPFGWKGNTLGAGHTGVTWGGGGSGGGTGGGGTGGGATATGDPNRLMFASTRLTPPMRSQVPAAGQESRLSSPHFFTPEYTLTELRLVMQNFWLDPSGGSTPEQDTGNVLSISGQALVVADQVYPVTYNGGASSVDIADGGSVISDPILVNVPPLTKCYVRTIDTVAPGQTRPAGMDRINGIVNPNKEGLEYASDPATLLPKLTSGGINTNLSGYIYGPSYVIAKGAWDGRPVVLIHGDSMMSPGNDTAPWADQYGCFGWGARGLYDATSGAQRLPHANLALYGSRPSNRSARSANGYLRTAQQFDAIKAINGGKLPFTAILSEHINNDASAGITGTALMTIMQNWWAFLKAEYPDARIVQTAAMPATKLSDNTLSIVSDNTNWSSISGQLFRTTDANWPPISASSIPGSRWWTSTAYCALLPANVDAVIDQTPFVSGLDFGKWLVPAFTATLTQPSLAGAKQFVMDTAPEIGEALVIEPGTSNVTGPSAFFVQAVSGAGPYTVTTFTASANAHPAGSTVKAASCADGVHGSPRLHQRLSQAIVLAKAAGKFGLPGNSSSSGSTDGSGSSGGGTGGGSTTPTNTFDRTDVTFASTTLTFDLT